MTTSNGVLTVEEYVETMQPWVAKTIARSVRRGGALFHREDLMQEANYTLVQVFNKYAGRVPEIELRKIGTTSVFYHVGNLYYREKAKMRGGDAQTFSIDAPWSGAKWTHDVHFLDVHSARNGSREEAFDRVLVQEAIERVASESDDVRAVLAAALDFHDARPAPLPSAEARAIFNRVKQSVRGVLWKDGYRKVEGRSKSSTEEAMETNGPQDPDTGVATMTAEKPAKAKAAKAAKKVVIGTTARLSADGTKAAASAFKKDQSVAYKGGARVDWLKTGTTLTVIGTVVSRGRTYVRCLAVNAKRKVTLSAAYIGKK